MCEARKGGRGKADCQTVGEDGHVRGGEFRKHVV